MTFREALFIAKKNIFEIRNYQPGNILSDFDVKIKLKWVGICGSDLSTLENNTLPELSLGHEWIGEIIEIGKHVQEKRIGDFVTSPVCVKCGRCSSCLAKIDPCEYPYSLTNNKGMLKEVVILPEKSLVTFQGPLNESSTLFEILAVAENVYLKTKDRLNIEHSILIMGAGLLGLSIGLVLQREGFKPIMVDSISSRISRAKSLGINCQAIGNIILDESKTSSFNFIFDATGDHLGSKGGWNYIEHLGKIKFTAIILAKYNNPQNLKTSLFFNKQATLEWIQGCTEESLTIAINKWKNQIEDLGKILITHVFNLNEVNEAFAMAKNRDQAARVVIKLD